MNDMPWRFLRLASRSLVKRNVRFTVEGLENVPRHGPVIIAARHYHHLYDGAVLLAMSARPLHVLVASDWADRGVKRAILEYLCRSARWPVVIRTGARIWRAGTVSSWSTGDTGVLLAAVRESVQLLHEGRMLLVFPEGYPTIDPKGSSKANDEFLPFEFGFARIASIAARSLATPIPIVPAGFAYADRPAADVTVRFGSPVIVTADSAPGVIVAEVERAVHHLSHSSKI